MPKYPITNFSRGEFGAELYGRVDIPQYTAGAKQLKNFIVQRYGGAARRPGFRYVGELRDTDERLLVPFQYSIEQSYVIVMGNSKMTLAALGGMITEMVVKITAITKATQAVLTIPFHA